MLDATLRPPEAVLDHLPRTGHVIVGRGLQPGVGLDDTAGLVDLMEAGAGHS